MEYLKIGITGGIGSGKSTIAHLIERMGYPVFYADREAKDIINHQPNIRAALIELLGREAFIGNEFNRPYVAAIVFKDSTRLAQLNTIVHPAVLTAFEHWCKMQKSRLVFLESAILFESGWESHFDYIINVDAPVETRIKRVMKRDAISEQQIRARMTNQLSDSQRRTKAHFTIDNGDNKLLLQQLLKILKEL